jgi:hypothetical protein
MRAPAHPARILIAAAAAACSALLVAACGSTATSGSAGGTTSATTTPSSGTVTPSSTPAASVAPSQAGPAPCAASDLKVAVPTGQGNGAAGSSYYPVQFTNASASPCTLFGYPGVSFVTGTGGSQIGAAATRNATMPKQLITLSAGQTVHAELQVVNAQNYPAADCGLVTAHWLKVYPPNQTAALYVSFTAQACSKPKTILSVQTVQPGASGT